MELCRQAFDATVDFHEATIESLPHSAKQFIKLTNDSYRRFVLQIVEEDFYHLDFKNRRIDNFTFDIFKSRFEANTLEVGLNADKLLGEEICKLFVTMQAPYLEEYLQKVKIIIEGPGNNKSKRFYKLSLAFLTQGIGSVSNAITVCNTLKETDLITAHKEAFLNTSPATEES